MTITKKEAEIAKLIADTERAKVDLEKARIDTDKARFDAEIAVLDRQLKEAEIREKLARALEAEHDAVIRKITRNERQRAEKIHLLQDHYAHEYLFDEGVSKKSVFMCLNTLAAWHREDPECDMNITINSPGGSVIDGMHLFDQITAYSLRGRDGQGTGGGRHKVTITVRGYAASMAGILLQCADERVIGPESWLMIHEVSAGTGGKIGEIEDDVKWYKKMCERVIDIFVERSNGNIDKEEFKRNWERRDWFLDSGEALELGFVDRIG